MAVARQYYFGVTVEKNSLTSIYLQVRTFIYYIIVLETVYAKVKLSGKMVSLEIYDTAGQEDFSEIRSLVYPGTDVFIMCYSCVVPRSLENIKVFWLPETQLSQQQKAEFLLVGNKLDLVAQANQYEIVDMNRGDEVVKQQGGRGHFQCSAKEESKNEDKEGTVQTIFKKALLEGLKAKRDRNRPPEIDEPWCCFCTLL